MDNSHRHGDPDYDTSYGVPTLSPSSTLARLSTTPADSNHEAYPNFLYGLSPFDTVLPSSLNAFHTSHDDSCLDTCIAKDCSLQQPYRGSFPPSHIYKPRLSSSSSSIARPQFQPENYAYTAQFQEPDFFSSFVYPDMKCTMGNESKPSNYFPYAGHHIGSPFGHITGPGITQQCPVPDDCVSVDCSQVSCSSNCCSTVCQDKSCTEGTPCNDVSCFDNNLQQPFGDIFDDFPDWHHPMNQGLADDLHNPPCNHTNTEHDVAFTLRDLKVPGSSNAQHHHPGVFQFECPFLSAEQSAADATRAFSLGPDLVDLAYGSTIVSSPCESRNCAEPPIASNNATQHVCNWVVGSPGDADKVCGRTFSDSSALNEHICADHISLLSAKTKYICLWNGCSRRDDQGFASRNKLKRHITTHTAYKPFACEQCGEGFSAQQALDQHRRTHTGEKPYKCPEPGCDKSFKQKSALTMHIRTHTGEKPLKCDICGKCFCESSNLSKHRKTHNPDYKFKCDEPGCDSQFIRIDQLRRHQAKHNRQKKKSRARSQAGLLTPSDEMTPTESQYPMTLEGEDFL